MARAGLKCGHENPDDVDFCEQCGEYVRWALSGVRQAVPAPPPAAPAGGGAEPPPPTSEYAQQPEPSEPDAVVVTLRRPEDHSATGGEVTGAVEAGGDAAAIALAR